MEHINMEQELSFFNLDKKWNDYIGAQKEIISKLKDDQYFTIGKGNRFQHLPKRVKMQKSSELLSPSQETDNYETQNFE